MCFIAEENFVQAPIPRVYHVVNGQLASVVAQAGLFMGVDLYGKYAKRCRNTVLIPQNDEESTYSGLRQTLSLTKAIFEAERAKG